MQEGVTPGTNAMVFGGFVQLVFALFFILEGNYILSIPLILMIGIIAIMQRYTALSYQSEFEVVG